MSQKAFSLLITLFTITLFSSLSIFIVELSNISSNVDTKNLLYTQANIHMRSAKNLISQIDIYDESKECIDTMNIDDKYFEINLYYSYITKREGCINVLSDSFDENSTKGIAIIDITIKPKEDNFGVTLHKRVVKKLE